MRPSSAWTTLLLLLSLLSSSLCSKCEKFGPSSVSKFYSAARGRLGNHVLNYAVLLQLNVSLEVQSLLDKESSELLHDFFVPESILLPVIDELNFCSNHHFEPYNEHIRNLLLDDKFRRGHLLQLWPAVHSNGITSGYSIDSYPCPEHQKLISAFYHTLRRTLRLKGAFIDEANQILSSVATNYTATRNISQQNGLDLFFVGVHNRRTDHLEFTRKVQGKKPLTKGYFKRAMDNFREEHEHTVFLFVSDDMDWAIRNINNKHKDVFFVGKGDGDDVFSIGVDLAVLAICNATITSRGTFGTLASVLNGGEQHTEYGSIVQDSDDGHDRLIF